MTDTRKVKRTVSAGDTAYWSNPAAVDAVHGTFRFWLEASTLRCQDQAIERFDRPSQAKASSLTERPGTARRKRSNACEVTAIVVDGDVVLLRM